MSQKALTSLDRVLTTLSHKEPDRVPFFLLLTMHGAKELGMSIKDYFSKAENVAQGQLQMREKYGHDCLYAFFYAPVEVEAFGAEVIFSDDGPPNSGTPMIQDPEKIMRLTPPDVMNSPCLSKVLDAISMMKQEVNDDAPIIGVAMSPFSLPVMQMGFDRYIEIMYEKPDLFSRLMEINQDFCISWSNAQLKAGATAICYFDPVSSSGMIPPELYLKTGFSGGKKDPFPNSRPHSHPFCIGAVPPHHRARGSNGNRHCGHQYAGGSGGNQNRMQKKQSHGARQPKRH